MNIEENTDGAQNNDLNKKKYKMASHWAKYFFEVLDRKLEMSSNENMDALRKTLE